MPAETKAMSADRAFARLSLAAYRYGYDLLPTSTSNALHFIGLHADGTVAGHFGTGRTTTGNARRQMEEAHPTSPLVILRACAPLND